MPHHVGAPAFLGGVRDRRHVHMYRLPVHVSTTTISHTNSTVLTVAVSFLPDSRCRRSSTFPFRILSTSTWLENAQTHHELLKYLMSVVESLILILLLSSSSNGSTPSRTQRY